MRFCPGCGKEIEKGTFCKKCEPLPELKLKDILIKACPRCSTYLFQNKWKHYDDIEDSVMAVVKAMLEKQLDDYDIYPVVSEHKKNPGVFADFEAQVEKGRNTFVIPGKIQYVHCKNCSKQDTEYFEGVLQVRNPNPDIEKFIDAFFKAEKAFISKMDKVKGGLDLHISSRKKLHELGGKLQVRFGGTLKESPRLFSRNTQTSKEVYRLTVYYLAPYYKEGDAIAVDGKVMKVTKVGKMVHGTDASGRSVAFDPKNKEITVLDKKTTTVSQVFPGIEILHPETFQQVPVENAADVKPGEKVKVVMHEGKCYIV